MRILTVNVGQPREFTWRGQTLTTAFFKRPVEGPVRAHRLGLEGDAQADLTVHGGPTNALYLFPYEHYGFWRDWLRSNPLAPGSFGENLLTEGLLETEVAIGDRFRIGSAVVRVTSPRSPCQKLAARFDRLDLGKAFVESRRTGFYLAVDEEGQLQAGDRIERVGCAADPVTVAEIVGLFRKTEGQDALLRRVVELPDLAPSWRDYFRERLTG
ncbi:MAG: MOSC domain-containing protein [Thermoanaerobaculia bacterium]|nr:MOSC domain-containing protein [Thermoanaerobaculia bacterium]